MAKDILAHFSSILAADRVLRDTKRARRANVLEHRLGVNGHVGKTLDETAASFAMVVTRERIRQIEAEAWAYYIPIVPEIMEARRLILKQLINHEGFLELATLARLEPSLGSFCTHPTALKASLKAMDLGGIHLTDSTEGPVLIRMSCADVAKLMGEMRRVRWTLPASEEPTVFAERFLEFIPPALLSVGALRRIVVQCMDLKDPTTEHVETSLKSILEPAVKGMLLNSPHPLHWNEIADRVRASLPAHVKFDDLALTGVLREPWALMLGQGTYGVESHLNLSEFAKRSIAREVQHTMGLNGPTDRQWSCVDLLAILPDDMKTMFSLDKFRLACVLRQAIEVIDLGRGIFVLNGGKPVERITFNSIIEASMKSLAHNGEADFFALMDEVLRVRSCGASSLRLALKKHPWVKAVSTRKIVLWPSVDGIPLDPVSVV